MLRATQVRNRCNRSATKTFSHFGGSGYGATGKTESGVGEEIFGKSHHLRDRRLLIEEPERDHPRSAWP